MGTNRESNEERINVSPQIYVIHHDAENYPTFESDIITPILAGNPTRDGYRIALRDTISDGGKKCITDVEKQDLYSEFTAYYYIWKNRVPKDKSSIIGIMHYRSFLDLTGKICTGKCSLESRFGYDNSSVINNMSYGIPHCSEKGIPLAGTRGVDVIVSEPLDFAAGIYEQFDNCHPLASQLFDKARKLIHNNPAYVDMEDYFDEHFSMGKYRNRPNVGFFKCLFISTWEFFDAYCDFIFYILDEMYNDAKLMGEIKKIQMIKGPDRPETQKKTRFRLLAFFAERLTSFYIAYSIKAGKFRVGVSARKHFEKMSDLVREVYPIDSKKHLKPMVRVYSIEQQDHMAVTDLNELDTMKKDGYFCEGTLGYVYNEKVEGSMPLYRIERGYGEHFTTKHKSDQYGGGKELGFVRDTYCLANKEVLNLKEYIYVGMPGGGITSINPMEFEYVGYDPEHAYADEMEDLGYTVEY